MYIQKIYKVYTIYMKKKILFSLEEEDVKFIEQEAERRGLDKSATVSLLIKGMPTSITTLAAELQRDPKMVLQDALTVYRKMLRSKKIPSNKVSKDARAEFLGISNLDKRWNTFMDDIEQWYYEK